MASSYEGKGSIFKCSSRVSNESIALSSISLLKRFQYLSFQKSDNLRTFLAKTKTFTLYFVKHMKIINLFFNVSTSQFETAVQCLNFGLKNKAENCCFSLMASASVEKHLIGFLNFFYSF